MFNLRIAHIFDHTDWQPSNGQMLFLALVQHASVGLTKLIGSACLSVGLHLKSRAIHIVLNVSP